MTIAQQLIVLLVMLGGGCAEDMPVTARYVPDCPPARVPDAGRILDIELPAPSPPAPERDPKRPDAGLIDLNAATQAELESLPGVGPALAQRIIEYREKRRFERIAHLRRVRGIGPATFARLEELVTVQKSKP